MTTIAWDGKTLAAERQITASTEISCFAKKIRKTLDGRLIGAAGTLGATDALLDWLESGGERPEFLEEKQHAEAIEIHPNGDVWFHAQFHKSKVCRGKHALGSGSSYALAAMECGKNAKDAVKIAIKFDANSGGKIDTLTLD